MAEENSTTTFSIIFAGTSPSKLISYLDEETSAFPKILINNSLACDFPSSSGTRIYHHIEESLVIHALSHVEFHSSPAETSLLEILKNENPLNLSDELLLINHVVAEAVDRQGRIEEVYDWLKDQFQLDFEIIPLFDGAVELRAIKNNRAGNLRYYQLTGKLSEELTVEEAKEKIPPNTLGISGTKGLEALKTHAHSSKLLKGSKAIVFLFTDWITLSAFTKINDLKRRMKKTDGKIVTIIDIAIEEENISDRDKELIEAILGPKSNIITLLQTVSEFSDFILIDTSLKTVVGGENFSCPHIFDEIHENPENIIEYLNNTMKLGITPKAKEETSAVETKTEVETEEKEEETISTEAISEQEAKPEKETPKPTLEDGLEKSETEETEESEEHDEIVAPVAESSETEISPEEAEAIDTEIIEKEAQESLEEPTPKKKTARKKAKETAKKAPEKKATVEEDQVASPEEKTVPKEESSKNGEFDIKDFVASKFTPEIEQEFPDLSELVKNLSKMPGLNESILVKVIEELVLLVNEDEGIASLAAQNLINSMISVENRIVRSYMAQAYAIISSHRPAVCKQMLTQNTLRIGLEGTPEERRRMIDILGSMARQQLESVLATLNTFINSFVKTDKPLIFERGKSFINGLAGNEPRLMRPIISKYLEFFDSLESERLPDLATAISSFDGATVGIELVTDFTLQRAKAIAEEIEKHLMGTSFIAIIQQIIDAWEQADVDKVAQLSGTILPSRTLEKHERLVIAKKIEKVGNIPIDTLSKSFNIDRDKLEAILVDLIVKDELDAHLEMVGDRMFVIMNNGKDNINSKETS